MKCCFQDLFKIDFIDLLYSLHIAFSLYVWLNYSWCIYTLVLTQPMDGRNPVLFHQGNQISICSTTCKQQSMHSLCVCWHRFQSWDTAAEVYQLVDLFHSFSIKLGMILSLLKHNLCFYLCSRRDQHLLLLVLGDAAGIRLGQVNLREDFGHLHLT